MAVTATPIIQQQVAELASGGQYIFYVWIKVASGTKQVSIAIVDNAYAGYLAGPTNITLTTAWQRFKITGTLASGQTGLWIVVRQFAGNSDNWTSGAIYLWDGVWVYTKQDSEVLNGNPGSHLHGLAACRSMETVRSPGVSPCIDTRVRAAVCPAGKQAYWRGCGRACGSGFFSCAVGWRERRRYGRAVGPSPADPSRGYRGGVGICLVGWRMAPTGHQIRR